MENTKTERKAWVDAGKGISMFLVMLFHSEVYFPSTETSYSDFFGYMRMPFFFFLSGYVFTSSLSGFSLSRKLKQILRGIVWTYLIFTQVIVLPKSLMNGDPVTDGILKICLGKASWFVITLGVSQLFYAVAFSVCRSMRIVPWLMLLSVTAGYFLKEAHPECLPYFLDSSLIVNFFVGAGILYRAHEEKIHRVIPLSRTLLVIAAALYTLFFLADRHWLQTPMYIYAVDNTYRNLPLYILYAVTGIGMMLLLVRLFRMPKPVYYIGRNSLVFYYLNGGVTRCLVFAAGIIGIRSDSTLHFYPATIVMALCAASVITLISKAIHRWCPIIIGDKETFNRLSSRLGLNIKW